MKIDDEEERRHPWYADNEEEKERWRRGGHAMRDIHGGRRRRRNRIHIRSDCPDHIRWVARPISATTSDEVRKTFLVVPNDEETGSISVSNDVSGISSATVSEEKVRGSVGRGLEIGSGAAAAAIRPSRVDATICFASLRGCRTLCETYLAVRHDEESAKRWFPISATTSDEVIEAFLVVLYLTTEKPNPFPFRTTYLKYPPRPYSRIRCADPCYVVRGREIVSISKEEPVADETISSATCRLW